MSLHSTEGSITYFINNEYIEKVEVRISNIVAENNPVVVYLPFEVNIENIDFNSQTQILAANCFEGYTLVSVFLYSLNDNSINFELSNKDMKIQNSIDFTSILREGEKHYALMIRKAKSSISREIHSSDRLFTIRSQYINISSPFKIVKYDKQEPYYVSGEINRNYALDEDDYNYYINYTTPSITNERKVESPAVFIVSLSIQILLQLLFSLQSLFTESTSKVISRREKGQFLTIFMVWIGSIAFGLIVNVGLVYTAILVLLGIASLTIYISARKQQIKEWLKERDKKKPLNS